MDLTLLEGTDFFSTKKSVKNINSSGLRSRNGVLGGKMDLSSEDPIKWKILSKGLALKKNKIYNQKTPFYFGGYCQAWTWYSMHWWGLYRGDGVTKQGGEVVSTEPTGRYVYWTLPTRPKLLEKIKVISALMSCL